MIVHYDNPTRAETDVDIGMVFALSTGYRTPLSAFGVNESGIRRLYDHGIKWGKLVRTTTTGKHVSWVLPTEGRWPTVAEMRERYIRHPPDTRWMTSPSDLSYYTDCDADGLAGGGAGGRVEELSLGDIAFENNVFALDAERVADVRALG